MTTSTTMYFKYTPIKSIDVEGSFFAYKTILINNIKTLAFYIGVQQFNKIFDYSI